MIADEKNCVRFMGDQFSQQKATSSSITPQVADYRAKASEWVAANEKKYQRPMSPHIQIYK